LTPSLTPSHTDNDELRRTKVPASIRILLN
jgi:hypothetical protein